jgi:hypothetical protein
MSTTQHAADRYIVAQALAMGRGTGLRLGPSVVVYIILNDE